MRGSALYGVGLGVGSLFFLDFLPQPAGSLLWWGFFAIQLTIGASVVWRRTRLPFATAALVAGGLACGVLAVLALQGYSFPNYPFAWWVVLGMSFLVGPVCLFVESRVHPIECKAWRDYMDDKGPLDILMGRHVPQLGRATRL